MCATEISTREVASSFEDKFPVRDSKRRLGLPIEENLQEAAAERSRLLRYIDLQLQANGFPGASLPEDSAFVQLSEGLVHNHRQKVRLLADHRCPADERIESFLHRHFADQPAVAALRLPARTLILDQHGMAKELSLPIDADEYVSDLVQSYRVKNGVLHNPKHDRRTTAGTFHVCEGGLPIAGDKRAVPRNVFVQLLAAALEPPDHLAVFPFTANCEVPASGWLSLLLRPIVCPEVPGWTPEKRMEVRFFAPGTLASNLDFVESIFGNAGDPFLPENDAGLDVMHWTGHTGAVILAPHLITLKKKDLGLPHYDDATERQRRDSMCWKSPDELYNDGTAFKVTCRTAEGVIVTIIADNYFGYCKKEVKTQISYAANLMGHAEEEHAGGALAFPTYHLGDGFQVNSVRYNNRTFDDVARDYGDIMDILPEGYGVDRTYNNLIYIPEDAYASLLDQEIRWFRDGEKRSIPLLPGRVYMAPSGYQLRVEKHPAAPSWRIIGTAGEGIYCHKPCTVSGGGKSEISKSLRDYMLYGPIFVSDHRQDFKMVREIFDRDYGDRWRRPVPPDGSVQQQSRPLLDPRRSLGSVIKLLTPSPEYKDAYNEWLGTIPNHIYAIVYIIKRFHEAGRGDDWEQFFGVDIVNGTPGHELKYRDRKLVGTYLRVGLVEPSAWRTFKVRQDFIPAVKIQTEDDISASVTVPTAALDPSGFAGSFDALAAKFVLNCESRLFQRPDDAIHRGLDKQTESDLARRGNFISNFEPLSREQVEYMTKYVVDFDAFSPPMQEMLRSVLTSDSQYVVCSANPRQVNGRPTKNPRYLQLRPDLADPLPAYVAEMGTRLFRKIPAGEPVRRPVNAVLVGRRNNPPDKESGIRSLAVYNPIHYQELPELFMDFISSLTGKSPSTTGAGSEGALTKGPFNALQTAADLNAALVSFILTGLAGFSTSAGHVGPNLRVDHDVSLLIPEIWCRMEPGERDPAYLIENGLLEPVPDVTFNGKTVPASRLGYRVTSGFIRRFFGRVFDNPDKVFDESMLQPEKQDFDAFADGVLSIVEVQERVAKQYLSDGTVDDLVPPLQAILNIMAHGEWNGHTVDSPEVRSMFTLEHLLESDWYQARLAAQQVRDVDRWKQRLEYLRQWGADAEDTFEREHIQWEDRVAYVEAELAKASDPAYVETLRGALGVQASFASA